MNGVGSQREFADSLGTQSVRLLDLDLKKTAVSDLSETAVASRSMQGRILSAGNQGARRAVATIKQGRSGLHL